MAWQLFEIIVNIIENYIMVDFVTRYLGYKADIGRPKKYKLIVLIILLLEISLVNYLTIYEGLELFVPVIIMYVYAGLILEGKIGEKLFVAFLPIVGVMLTAPFTILLASIFLQVAPIVIIVNNDLSYIIVVIISKITLKLILELILRIKRSRMLDLENRQWLLLAGIPILSIVTVNIIMLDMLEYASSGVGLIKSLALILEIIVIDILLFFLLVEMSKNNQLRMNNKILGRKNSYQRQKMYDRPSKHDEAILTYSINNMLLAIKLLAENNRTDEIIEYCKSLIKPIESKTYSVNTGNRQLDELINYKFNYAHKNKVKIVFMFDPIPLNSIDTVDLCILIGDLLDNAVEASFKEVEGAREISLYIEAQLESLTFQIANSITRSVLENNPDLTTTKGNRLNKETGIDEVREILKKYEGTIRFYEKNNRFFSEIRIMISK